MPTYEYACRECGEHLEVVQSFKDDPLTTCPNCQGELRKVFSAAGIIFKGSGWHIKDYGSSKGASTGSSEPSKDTTSKGSGDASSTSHEGSGKSSGKGSDSSSGSSADKSA